MNILERKSLFNNKNIIDLSISQSIQISLNTVELTLVFNAIDIRDISQERYCEVNKENLIKYNPRIKNLDINNFYLTSVDWNISFDAEESFVEMKFTASIFKDLSNYNLGGFNEYIRKKR